MKAYKRLTKKRKKEEKKKPAYIYTVTIRFTEKDKEVAQFLKKITPVERGGFIRALLKLYIEKGTQPAAVTEKVKPPQDHSKAKKNKTDKNASIIAEGIKLNFT